MPPPTRKAGAGEIRRRVRRVEEKAFRTNKTQPVPAKRSFNIVKQALKGKSTNAATRGIYKAARELTAGTLPKKTSKRAGKSRGHKAS
jgi:hypothetical protein